MENSKRMLSVLIIAACAAVVYGQQTNGPTAAALWGLNNCSTTSTATPPFAVSIVGQAADLTVGGAAQQPFVLAYASGGISVGSIVSGVGSIDLDLGTAAVLLDGFNPMTLPDMLSRLNSIGSATLAFPITQTGYIGAFQAVVADPTSPFGASLTAATDLAVTEGISVAWPATQNSWICLNLTYGTMYFYDTAYTNLCVTDDAVILPGQSLTTSPVVGVMPGVPLIAPCVTDLAGGTALNQTGFACFIETAAGFTITFRNMFEWNAGVVLGTSNTFSTSYSYSTGVWTMTYPAGGQTAPLVSIGITPANLMAPVTSVANFVPFSSCGASSIGPLPAGQGIFGNNVVPPSGCGLAFTPTVFSPAAGLANQYRLN